MELETLIQDFFGCRANKKRTIDVMHFDLYRERDIVRLYEDFENRDLPSLIYSFVKQEPRWREVNACLMQNKVIQYHFDIRVRPLIEDELTDRTFNNRVGYGTDVAVNRLLEDIYEVSEGYTRDAWIFFADISAYFPSADLRRSYDHYRDLIERRVEDEEERDELLYILLRTTWSYTAHNTHLRSPRWMWTEHIPQSKTVVFSFDFNHGASLGNQHWQVAQNYDLNDFDHKQVVILCSHYGRYVDDMWWITADKAQGLMIIKQAEADLAEYGYILHPHKRYCQHVSKGGKFISTPFKPGRVYVNNSVVRRCEMRIRYWNAHVSVSNLDSFLASINSYLGKMKRVNAYAIIRNVIEKIAPRWWRFCFFNDRRRCILANPEYRRAERLKRKYHFKYHSKHEPGRNYFNYGFCPVRIRKTA